MQSIMPYPMTVLPWTRANVVTQCLAALSSFFAPLSRPRSHDDMRRNPSGIATSKQNLPIMSADSVLRRKRVSGKEIRKS